MEERVREARERQEMEERALEGLKVHLPGVFGGLCRGLGMSVDGRVEESRSGWRREVEVLLEGLQRDRVEW